MSPRYNEPPTASEMDAESRYESENDASEDILEDIRKIALLVDVPDEKMPPMWSRLRDAVLALEQRAIAAERDWRAAEDKLTTDAEAAEALGEFGVRAAAPEDSRETQIAALMKLLPDMMLRGDLRASAEWMLNNGIQLRAPHEGATSNKEPK